MKETTAPIGHRLGNLQLRILKILWASGEADVNGVREVLNQTSDLAYTSVATMLRKMETRGLVTHRTEGRSFIYRATAGEDAVSQGMTRELLTRLFGGSITNLVSHLLRNDEVDRKELEKLEKLIAEQKRRKS